MDNSQALSKLRQEILSKHEKRGWVSCGGCGKSFTISRWNNTLRCGLEVHHKKTRGAHPELKLDKSNCELLCRNCHRVFA